VEAILTRCEEALRQPGPVGLRALGFWRAVRGVERHPEWVPDLADRIGAIDRDAFERRVPSRISVGLGGVVLGLSSLLGAGLLAGSTRVGQRWRAPLLLGGTVVLLGATHDFAHLLVGNLLRIRFISLYPNGFLGLRPGLKVDYGSYLRASPLARAAMHASGAVVTKLVPFAALVAARRGRAPRWMTAFLLGLGLFQIVTDVVFSTRSSDWKRVRQQLALLRPGTCSAPAPERASCRDARGG
jgi:hypothetical protein